MATDGQLSFVTFLYDDIQWTSDINEVGISPDETRSVGLPGSGSSDLSHLVTTSNVGVEGMWMYRVDSSVVLAK